MSLSSLKIQSLPRFSLNFAANIMASLLMLIGSIRAFEWVKPSFSQFLLFCGLALSSNILFSWLVADTGSHFNKQGLIGYLIWPMVMLIAGIVLSKRYQNDTLLFVPAILWLTADTMLILLQSSIQFMELQGWLPIWTYDIIAISFMLLFVWQTASLFWVFAKKLGWRWWEQVSMLIGAVAMLWVWQQNIKDQPIFKTDDTAPTISETAFYVQPLILTEQLSALQKNNEGVSDWYFVGVAGFGGQNVFMNEINKARQLFDVRFGTQGKSITLINNPNTWQSEPIASRTSLEKTLKHLGQTMNPSEDVLFLTISSHGAVSESGKILGGLVLDNAPLELDDIDPDWLRQALDDSGIRWRVIVISACYSGTFIEKLSSPTTTIITASRADRASFGCSDDADLTYFGRAFFAEALRDTTSLEDAFKYTTERIANREALMGFSPSEPQMVSGSLMKNALPEFEKALFIQDNVELGDDKK